MFDHNVARPLDLWILDADYDPNENGYPTDMAFTSREEVGMKFSEIAPHHGRWWRMFNEADELTNSFAKPYETEMEKIEKKRKG